MGPSVQSTPSSSPADVPVTTVVTLETPLIRPQPNTSVSPSVVGLGAPVLKRKCKEFRMYIEQLQKRADRGMQLEARNAEIENSLASAGKELNELRKVLAMF